MPAKQQGFTLIELMIVVAIIGILTAMAVPAYQGYVIKTKWASNIAELDAIKTSIKICLNENATAGTLCNSQSKLAAYGFAGSQLPQPPYATGEIQLSGSDNTPGQSNGFVNITFTGTAEVDSRSYNANCAKDDGGNIRCTAVAGQDTLDPYVKGSGR